MGQWLMMEGQSSLGPSSDAILSNCISPLWTKARREEIKSECCLRAPPSSYFTDEDTTAQRIWVTCLTFL